MVTKWNDEYWLLLMQLYLRKPMGTKPLYSRGMVNLALELHLSPQYLYRKMMQLRRLDTPRIERLWNTYANNPQELSKGVKLLRKMQGFNNAATFYEGVEVNESFETEFKPLPECDQLTPMMLVIILDLFIIEAMDIFQVLDPCLRRTDMPESCLVAPCRQVWQRFGNDDPTRLAAYAAQLHEYFR